MEIARTKKKKGAFQLSLGFIIVVVFAIVLLSFAIQWLSGAIGSITDITEALIQEAELELEKTFQESDSNFAIWPPEANPFSVEPNTKMAVVAGIRNGAQDSTGHKFGVAIEYQEGSGPDAYDGDPNTWIKTTYDNSIDIEHLRNAKFPLIIEVPGATTGTYTFKITACTDSGESGIGCPPGVPTTRLGTGLAGGDGPHMWGGAVKFFVLEVAV